MVSKHSSVFPLALFTEHGKGPLVESVQEPRCLRDCRHASFINRPAPRSRVCPRPGLFCVGTSDGSTGGGAELQFMPNPQGETIVQAGTVTHAFAPSEQRLSVGRDHGVGGTVKARTPWRSLLRKAFELWETVSDGERPWCHPTALVTPQKHLLLPTRPGLTCVVRSLPQAPPPPPKVSLTRKFFLST